ncbi:MAG TPA: TPM domain-containing protein [Thermoanaerobaculia bacterium]
MSAAARRTALAVLVLLIAGGALADRYDELVPEKPTRYVTDRAGVLGSGRAEALNARLEQFERDTSDQLLVWVDRKIPEGFTLEDFTVRAAQKWGPGQKKIDNAVILFVFTEDRKMRIEVGYGLEGALPDALAHRIQEEEILPRFRSGDFAGGIEAGMTAMMAAIKGEYKGSGKTVNERQRGRSGTVSTCIGPAIVLLMIFVVFPLIARRNLRSGRSHGGRGWWNTGGWGGGGFGGGGWGGGGGFSGGGFSGGGGSFGGGGSSGSW